MKVRYYYDPAVRKTESGEYQVDIYIDICRTGVFYQTITDKDYIRLMTRTRILIYVLNVSDTKVGLFRAIRLLRRK